MADVRLRLLCFPPAGGYAAPYRAWQTELPEGIEVVPIDLDQGHPDVGSLVDALQPTLVAAANLPVAVFGHSFGALIGYELARHLRDRGLPLARLFVSSCPAPPLARPRRLPIPPDAPDPERLHFWFSFADGYEYVPRPALDRPISVLGGLRDPLVRPEELRAWKERTTSEFRLRMLPGSHELLRESGTYVLRAIAADLDHDLKAGET